jgi:hypothetical protein
MGISDKELEKRIHYRHEFAIRNKRYEGLKKEIAELENIRRKPNYVKNIAVDKRYFELLAELLVYDASPAMLSTIQVKHRNEWLGLNYKELPSELEEFSDIYAVDKEEKTIIIKIYLGRKKEDIIKDVKFLLDLLDKEAKRYKVDLKAKKPRWGVYDDYLKVYDLKEAKPEMEWSEIAKLVFPGEVIKEHNAPHRKTRKKELASNSSISKVFHYWKEANKMINKEGWRQI